MNLLIHVCCGPCLIYPYAVLSKRDIRLTGLFYNPNIHPWREYEKRRDTLRQYASQIGLATIYAETYDMENFLRGVALSEGKERCRFCYEQRLRYAAQYARDHHYDAFSTTLLYSRYQKHDLIREVAEQMAETFNVAFFYEDFRPGWQQGVTTSKQLGMYRQPYCGCIYSEKERFMPPALDSTP